MGYHKRFNGLAKLPEVKELKNAYLKRGYRLGWCDDSGLRMQKGFTEIHFIPETERLRVCIHDDGMRTEETDIALKIAEEIVLKYGYKKGEEKLDEDGQGIYESEDEYYKYF